MIFDDNSVVLHNRFIVRNMPKTTAKVFKDIKSGDILEISFDFRHGSKPYGKNNMIRPTINGEVIEGTATLCKLLDRGMILEEISDLESMKGRG